MLFSVKIKDSSNILASHGGLLDRLDGHALIYVVLGLLYKLEKGVDYEPDRVFYPAYLWLIFCTFYHIILPKLFPKQTKKSVTLLFMVFTKFIVFASSLLQVLICFIFSFLSSTFHRNEYAMIEPLTCFRIDQAWVTS